MEMDERMEVEIKALTPELAGDYMVFFKNDAFSDHKEWSFCCCLHFHWNEQLDAEVTEFIKTAAPDDHSLSWLRAEEYVKNGTIKGYLAYADNRVVGWCNANDRENYSALKQSIKPEIWDGDDGKKAKSAVCFAIAPDMRGKGIAAKLLARICDDAKQQGYDYVEAYPAVCSRDVFENYHGPDSLYYHQGFVLHKELDGQAVLRKYFH